MTFNIRILKNWNHIKSLHNTLMIYLESKSVKNHTINYRKQCYYMLYIRYYYCVYFKLYMFV